MGGDEFREFVPAHANSSSCLWQILICRSATNQYLPHFTYAAAFRPASRPKVMPRDREEPLAGYSTL